MKMPILFSINVSNCQVIETCSAKIIFICLYHNHLNDYASVHILVPGEFVFVLPHTSIALLCHEIGLRSGRDHSDQMR